jgi:hypothetical protein
VKLGIAVVLAVLAQAAPARGDDAVRQVFDRVYLSGFAGDGWTAIYFNDRVRSTAASAGVAATTVIGVDNFGLELGVGLSYDRGTTPDPMMEPRDALWMVDLGFGIAASPYALVEQPRFELRLDAGVRGGLLLRQGCAAERCDQYGEPTVGVLPIARAGLVAWFGDGRGHGVGLDVVFMRGKLGDLHTSSPTDAELHPPAWLVRLSWLPYRRPRASR